MQRIGAWAVLLMCLLVSGLQAQTADDNAAFYDRFDSTQLTLWECSNPAVKVEDHTLMLGQKVHFKRMPLLSKQVFDLDLASQQHPVDMTVKLISITGNASNTKEYNNLELGWADEQGQLVFGWRWEWTMQPGNHVNRLFNSESWSDFRYTKAPDTLFAKDDVIGLRVTDTTVQILCNGKVIRSVGRPSDLKNTGKCRLYLSFVGPANRAAVSLDDVRIVGAK